MPTNFILLLVCFWVFEMKMWLWLSLLFQIVGVLSVWFAIERFRDCDLRDLQEVLNGHAVVRNYSSASGRKSRFAEGWAEISMLHKILICSLPPACAVGAAIVVLWLD